MPEIFLLKGQANFEFMIFVSIMFIILALASYAAITGSHGIESDNEVAEARRVASSIASEINIAAEVGDGYSRTFYIQPLFYNGLNYSINVSETGFVNIYWENKAYSLPVLARSVTGTVEKGATTIKNTDGVISFA